LKIKSVLYGYIKIWNISGEDFMERRYCIYENRIKECYLFTFSPWAFRFRVRQSSYVYIYGINLS